MAGQTDKFGIPMWYASKPSGFFYESSNTPTNDDAFEAGSETKTTGTNEVTMSPNGPTNFHLGKNVQGFKDSIGGCGLKFPDAEGRGYAYKKDDVRDIEIKGVFKFNIGSNGFSISVCTGHHTGSKCCQGHAYMITVEPSQSPYTGLFRKEMWHVSYHPSPEGDFDIPGISNDNVWVGLGLVRYNKGNDSVVLECWANVHPDSDIKDWKMIKRIIDKPGNGWGNDGNECGGDKDQVLTWSGPKNRFKTNASSGTVKAKMLSMREIDPLGTIDPGGGTGGGGVPGGGGIPPEPPNPPTAGTVFRDWVLPYSIITFPDDACQTGSATGTLLPFYDVTDNGSSSNLHRDRYRAGMVANGSASKFVGKKPRRVRMWLSADGSPPPGDITVVLRKNNTDEVAVTYVLTAVDGVVTAPPLDATALSSTKKEYTFENLTSEYVWQIGDRLMVEYSGNTVDTTNDINVFRNTDNPYDGVYSCAIKFDAGGPPPTGYSAPDTSRDYAWEISEIGTGSSDSSSPPVTPTFVKMANYDVAQTGAAKLDDVLFRYGEMVKTATSLLFNHKPAYVEVYLSKTGSPTGNVSVVVRKSSDDSIAHTFGTIDASTLDTTLTKKTFNTTINTTYFLALGDKIMVEYTNGTSSNYVNVGRNILSPGGPFDGVNSIRIQKGSGAYDESTDRDLAGIIWEQQ